MEDRKVHYRHFMLLCFNSGKNASKTLDELCSVYGENAVSISFLRGHEKTVEKKSNQVKMSSWNMNRGVDLIKALVQIEKKFK